MGSEERGEVLEVNDKRLRRELGEEQRRLEEEPRNSRLLQSVARSLRWLGDPEAEEIFKRLASRFEEGVSKARETGRDIPVFSIAALGDFHRLSGNYDRARYWYERIYSKLNEQYLRSDLSFNDERYYAEVLFLLGRYEELVSLREHRALEEEDDPEKALTASLCRAIIAGDLSLAEEATEGLAEYIRKYRLRPGDTGFELHPWDRYENFLRIKAGMEGREDVIHLSPRELLRRETESREHQQPQKSPELPGELPGGFSDEPSERKRLTGEQLRKILEEEEQPDLYRMDLSGLDLVGQRLTGAVLVEADLSGANLSTAILVEADLTGADLTGADLRGALIQQAILSGAKLDRDVLSRIASKNLTYTDLSGTDLRGHDLSGVDLREAVLLEADLRKANLGNADLRGANLTGADLRGADLRGADLTGANLEEAELEGAILDETRR